MAWITLGEGDDSRGLAWSDNELQIMRGNKAIAKVTLTKITASSDQTGQEMS